MRQPKEWTRVEGHDFKEILYEKKHFDNGDAVRISINRPDRMNAVTGVGMIEIAKAFLAASVDDSVGVVVFTGVGDTAFCSGGDQGWESSARKIDMMVQDIDLDSAILDCPKPVIAAVKGWAIGGGHHWAYLCDFTIAADNAKFGQNEPRVGSSADGFYVSYLARVIGAKKAREMWMLCRRYTAQEALSMGLVNKVVPLDKLDEEVDKWCQEILALSPTCLRVFKASFNAEIDYMRTPRHRYERMLAPKFIGSEEQKEAQTAFAEKRNPNFGKVRKEKAQK